MRMMASVAPPADHGTMIRMGSDGCQAWAAAAPDAPISASANA